MDGTCCCKGRRRDLRKPDLPDFSSFNEARQRFRYLLNRALGFPTNTFTTLFSIGRLPGWLAHWTEMHDDDRSRIGRPRQIYTGMNARPWVSLDDR